MSNPITHKIANDFLESYRVKKIPPATMLNNHVASLRRIFAHRPPATRQDKALLEFVKLAKKRGGVSQMFYTDIVKLLTDLAVAFKFSPDQLWEPIETAQ